MTAILRCLCLRCRRQIIYTTALDFQRAHGQAPRVLEEGEQLTLFPGPNGNP